MNFNFTINRTINLEEVTSTQDIAKQTAKTVKENGILIVAKTQTAGRGRFERKWESKKGGLYFSILLRPNKKTLPLETLSLKAGRAVAETLTQMYGIKTKIKLPNDVLAAYENTYKKIAGILIETSSGSDGNLQWLALGIGIDTNNIPSKHLQAVSIRQITGKNADNKELLNKFLANFAKEYITWNIA